MNDASFRRAQAMYDAQLPPGWDDDDDESPAEEARALARELRLLARTGPSADPLKTVAEAEALLGMGIDVGDCDLVSEYVAAIEKAAEAWELRANDPGPDPDDLYEETGRWSL